jgi:fumarylacetoacetase
MAHADGGGAGLSAFSFGWGRVEVGGRGAQPAARIGDEVVVLRGNVPSLRPLIEAGPEHWAEVRAEAESNGHRLPLADCTPLLPVEPRDYIDFYASLEHATNVGRMFRPDQPLEPNWRHLPVGYHGRAASVVVSGTPVTRPRGQLGEGRFGPTRALDYECELGLITDAHAHIFGLVLLNDWSARDIQAWEYRPLGPFLGKSFATSISPWIVPLDDIPTAPARRQDPQPLPYLRDAGGEALDLELEVAVNGEVLTRTNARGLYWTPAQMLAHATSGGAPVTAGDLFGTGTISGSEVGSEGCLLERFGGERWLEDGDEVVLRSPNLGECAGPVMPCR